jgi:hypothetical protein
MPQRNGSAIAKLTPKIAGPLVAPRLKPLSHTSSRYLDG